MTIKTSIGTITANKEVLNQLSVMLRLANDSTEGQHFVRADILADDIFNALDKTGYYDAYIRISQ